MQAPKQFIQHHPTHFVAKGQAIRLIWHYAWHNAGLAREILQSSLQPPHSAAGKRGCQALTSQCLGLRAAHSSNSVTHVQIPSNTVTYKNYIVNICKNSSSLRRHQQNPFHINLDPELLARVWNLRWRSSPDALGYLANVMSLGIACDRKDAEKIQRQIPIKLLDFIEVEFWVSTKTWFQDKLANHAASMQMDPIEQCNRQLSTYSSYIGNYTNNMYCIVRLHNCTVLYGIAISRPGRDTHCSYGKILCYKAATRKLPRCITKEGPVFTWRI